MMTTLGFALLGVLLGLSVFAQVRGKVITNTQLWVGTVVLFGSLILVLAGSLVSGNAAANNYLERCHRAGGVVLHNYCFKPHSEIDPQRYPGNN
jgi:hypothetical protein